MMKFIHALLGLSIVFSLAYLSPNANGQVGKHHFSVESMFESLVAEADFVAIGKLASFRKQGVPTSETARLLVQPFFAEILKQPIDKHKLDELKPWPPSSSEQKLINNKTSGVWFIKFSENGEVSANPPSRKFLPFEEFNGYSQTQFGPPMLTNDLSVLKTQAAILARLRQCCEKKNKPKKDKRPSIIGVEVPRWLVDRVLSGDANSMSFVLDEECEKTAKSLVTNPAEFCRQRQLKADQLRLHEVESLGLELLQHYPSEENTALVKKLLLAPVNNFELNTFYPPPQISAFEILLKWGVTVDRPSFWESITKLDLSNSVVEDSTMLQIAKLDNLEQLNLKSTPVTKVGLSRLKPLQQLTLINLDNSQVTDENIRALKEVGLLDKISAVGWKRDNETIVRSAPPTSIQSLNFGGCKLTDQGLKAFSSFEYVVWINLRGTRISDDGLDSLSRLPQLKTLFIGETQITDLGVEKIARHKQLETLSLRGLQISDRALASLEGLSKLQNLNLEGTQVSPQAIAKLQKVLSKCRILPPQPSKVAGDVE